MKLDQRIENIFPDEGAYILSEIIRQEKFSFG